MVLSAQQYNAIGELVNKELGNNQQTVDYRYNIRGWLTQINELSDAQRYFNQELSYDHGFTQKQYNGNISGVKWNRAGGKQHAYGYLYDEVNRITGADYRAKPLGASWATSPGKLYGRQGELRSQRQHRAVEALRGAGRAVVPVGPPGLPVRRQSLAGGR